MFFQDIIMDELRKSKEWNLEMLGMYQKSVHKIIEIGN